MGVRQFSLRRSMLVVAAWACTLAWVRSQGSFESALAVVSHSIVAWGFCLALAVVLARAFGPAVSGRRGRQMVSGLFVVAFLATLYLAWGHHRTMFMFMDGLNHGFPYPDGAINALERWFDVRWPVSPGNLKLHGEFPRVGFVLGMLVFALTSLTGLLLGVLSNRPEGTPQSIGDTSDM